MTQPHSHDIEGHKNRMAYLSETILVDDEADVEAHGILRVAAAAAAIAGSAGGTLLATAETARAVNPGEPARLTQALYGSTGATAAAVFVYSNTPTQVVKWPSTYSASSSPPAAGTPCSTGDLAAGATTSKLIQAYGNYRRCI